MSYTESELVEPTSSRNTGHQVRDGCAITQSKIMTQIFPVGKQHGQEMEKSLRKRNAETTGIQLKGRTQGLGTITEAMEWSQKGPYNYCHLKYPMSRRMSQMKIFTCNHLTKYDDSCA